MGASPRFVPFAIGVKQCRMLAAIFMLAGAVALPCRAEPSPSSKPDWDQVANIKDAAARVGRLQRAKGAEAVYKFIDACYRTHTIAENYTAGFESCVAQDYLETKMLMQIYARTPPETLRKHGTPTPEALGRTMNRRILSTFARYKKTVSDANAFKSLVDQHGLPIFIAMVFPDAVRELQKDQPENAQPKHNNSGKRDKP